MIQDLQNKDRIITDLLCEVNELRKENTELKRHLAIYETLKNSRNSLILLSKDENSRKRGSLPEKTGRKPRRQHGRKESALRMVPNPDTINNIPRINSLFAEKIFQEFELNLQENENLLIYLK